MQGERASRSLGEMRIGKTILLEVTGDGGTGRTQNLGSPRSCLDKNAPCGGSIKCQERCFCREREAALQEKCKAAFSLRDVN